MTKPQNHKVLVGYKLSRVALGTRMEATSSPGVPFVMRWKYRDPHSRVLVSAFVFRSVPVSKLEKDPGEYNVE